MGREPFLIVRVPSDIGSNSGDRVQKTKNKRPRPPFVHAVARAMFFTNNHVKNDMNVSRETMRIYCAEKRFLLTA